MSWQPIETAPVEVPVRCGPPGTRDGACGVFSGESVRVAVAILKQDYFKKYYNDQSCPDRWYGDIVEFEHGWESTGSYTMVVVLHPTHWMPLPAAPDATPGLAGDAVR
jgi:hypothetical protein